MEIWEKTKYNLDRREPGRKEEKIKNIIGRDFIANKVKLFSKL